MQSEVKVGLLVVVAFVILGVAVFLVSERRNFFALKNRYYIQFETVLGLAPGSPAQLNGVTVGSVKRVVLPESVDEEMLTVWINVDRRYGDRVREDSTARIKTLGLLGRKTKTNWQRSLLLTQHPVHLIFLFLKMEAKYIWQPGSI